MVSKVEEVVDKEPVFEAVSNDQGNNYFLTIPLFLTYQDKIFRWNRQDSKYDLITYETFLEETHQ
jgi:hypothetical protein